MHLHARIGLKAPQQIGTAPGRQMMAASCIPQKAKHVAHGYIIEVAGS